MKRFRRKKNKTVNFLKLFALVKLLRKIKIDVLLSVLILKSTVQITIFAQGIQGFLMDVV